MPTQSNSKEVSVLCERMRTMDRFAGKYKTCPARIDATLRSVSKDAVRYRPRTGPAVLAKTELDLSMQRDAQTLKDLMSRLHAEQPHPQNPHPKKVFCVEGASGSLPDPKMLSSYVSAMRTWTTSAPLLMSITSQASSSCLLSSSPDLSIVDGDVVHRRVLEYAYVRSKWIEAGHGSVLEDLELGAGWQFKHPECVEHTAESVARELEAARSTLQECETSLSSCRAQLVLAQDAYRTAYDNLVHAASAPETCVEAYPRLTHVYSEARAALPASLEAFKKSRKAAVTARSEVRRLEIRDAVARSMVPYSDQARAYGTRVIHRLRARSRRAVEIGERLLSACASSSPECERDDDGAKADAAIAAMVESMRRRCVKGSDDVRRILREGYGVTTLEVNGVTRPV